MTAFMKPSLLIAFLASLILLVAPACNSMRGAQATEDYNASPLTVAVPGNLSAQTVQELMVKAFQNRDWSVTSSSANEVTATLDHRGFNAQATLQRNGDIITLYNHSTYNNPKTGESEPAVPYGWLENIQKDLRVYLARGN